MYHYNRDRSQSDSRSKSPSIKKRQEHKVELEELNNLLRHLGDTTLPREPYLVSVPSDVPYRHSSRFVNTWHIGVPFSKSEEQLQYMSFLQHQESEESLLKVVGGWSDDLGNVLEEEDGKPRSPRAIQDSGRTTPADRAQRKKISLNQYKTKGKGDTEVSVEAEEPLGLEKHKEREERAMETAGMDKNELNNLSSGSPVNTKKRAREDEGKEESKSNRAASPIYAAPDRLMSTSPRPAKKSKVVPSPTQSKGEEGRKAAPLENPRLSSRAVPGLLSPTLPPKAEEILMPALLSPTIPQSIQEFLDAEPSRVQLDGMIDRRRSDSVRSLLAAAGLGDSGERMSPGPATSQSGNRIRSDSQHSVKSTHSTTSGLLHRAPVVRTPARSSTPLQNGFRSSPGPRQRHIIMLKYGKRNRKRVEALLKFASRPKKPERKAVVARVQESPMPEPKLHAKPEPPAVKQRPRERTPDTAIKLQRHHATLLTLPDKPSTPIPTPTKSPSSQNAALQPRSAFTTPKKDLKATAMRRVESSDGLEARTPLAEEGSRSTPQGAGTTIAKVSPAPTSAPSGHDDERSAWNRLGTKYFALGRVIKTEGTRHGTDASPEQSALSTVLMIEGLLCFMINLAALAYARPNHDPGWRAIIPYLDFVLRISRKTTHLHGLAIQLGAVCRQFVHKYDLERLARDPLPDEQTASAPTPGSDGNTKTQDDGDKYKKKYIEFRDQLVRNSRDLQTAWLEGSKLLSHETLKDDFPTTWARRATNSSLRGTERPSPGDLGGSYYLPLDANTTTLEAVRFAVEVLQEWSAKEHIDWKCRVEL